MASRFRSPLFLVAIYAAFFASGAGSLIAEVTWNRMLIVVVGNSLSATALILVVFMGGLGFGSYIGGRIFGKRRASLIPYLVIETAVGLYVLLSPALFDLLARVFTGLSESTHNAAGLTAVRLAVSLGALLIPACLMGATFPAMIAGTAPDSASRRTVRTGYLYSINTLGAAVGCFAAGYHLLFEFGVRFTLGCAFGLYLTAASLALLANALRERRPDQDAVAEPAGARGPDRERPRRRYIHVATFGIGFVALAYEVLLTRLSILFLGNSVSVFPLVLTAFLLGTGISALVGTRVHDLLQRRGGGPDRLLACTALAAGVCILLPPYALLADWVLDRSRFANLADAVPQNPLPILAIIIAPTILIGALLPIAIRMLQREGRGEATRGAATLYAVNTVGGLLGAGLANHYLVPLVGIQGTLAGLSSICVAIGVAGLLPSRRLARGWGAFVPGIVVVTAILGLALPGMMNLYARKIAASTGANSTQVRLVREGRAATVTVIDQADPSLGTYRDMYLNGVEEASTRYWHTQLFKLLGILPALVHPSDQPKDALVVAFGAGITAGSVLASEEVASLDVVDLNPDIGGINDLFTEVNGNVFRQPRFHFHNDDGRNYLVTSNRRYDLIISDSTHPRAYDSWILYTEEFYEAVKSRLRPGGVFAQWVPVLGSMQGDLFRIHLNTFRRVFPHATFWYVYGSDQAFLLATPEPLALDAPRLQEKLDRLPAWFRAVEYQIDTVAHLAGFFWMDEAAIGKMIGRETRINRDDRHYFDKQSAVRPSPPQLRLPWFQASVIPSLQNATNELREASAKEQAVARLVGLYGFFGAKDDLYRAYRAMPDNGNARYFMAREFADQLPDPSSVGEDPEIASYRTAVARHPDDPVALNALADLLGEAGQLDEALPLAEKAVGLAPGNGMVLDTYGWILFKQKKTAAALAALAKAASYLPDHPIVLYHLGAACLADGRRDQARAHLTKALGASHEFPGADQAREILRKLE
jgi:spermidine synthase